jgi:hypothetical protein
MPVDAAADGVTTLNPTMSRGLGHIERTILRMIEDNRREKRCYKQVGFHPSGIVHEAYGDWAELSRIDALPYSERDLAHLRYWARVTTRAHRVAVLRAMHSFVRKHRRYALIGGNGTKPLVLVAASRAAALAKHYGVARVTTPRTRHAMQRKPKRSRDQQQVQDFRAEHRQHD